MQPKTREMFLQEIEQYPPSRQSEHLLHAVKSEVAKILGIKRQNVDQIIRGDRNPKLERIVDHLEKLDGEDNNE